MQSFTWVIWNSNQFVKLPNFLSVDCKPFDPETYEDEIEDEENPDEEGMLVWFIERSIATV